MIDSHHKKVIETALLCAAEPLSLNELSRLFGEDATADYLQACLVDIQEDWSESGMELVHIATGWRFQSRLSMREYLDRLTVEKPPKYSRAVLETLAIVAYHQPVTRGEIEEIRGVTVNTNVVRQLEERGWIEVIGHKDSLGRPALYATTKQFLDDMGIPNLQALPTLDAGIAASQISQQVINFEETLLEATDISESDVPQPSHDEAKQLDDFIEEKNQPHE
jgi:segregation and condensation protein B